MLSVTNNNQFLLFDSLVCEFRKNIKVDILNILKKFIAKKDLRKQQLCLFQVSNDQD